MRALTIALVAACAHREPPPPPPPAPAPAPAPPVDAAVPDAPPIPTASGVWHKEEVASPPAAVAEDTVTAIRARLPVVNRCFDHGGSPPRAVELSVGHDGSVTKVHVKGTEPATAACIERAYLGLHLPAADEGSVVGIPFTE